MTDTIATTDTEARRLAEQVLNEPKTYRDVVPLARAYLNLITRLETPGLTEHERYVVEAFQPTAFRSSPNIVGLDVLLSIISRLTQPTSTAGEGAWQDIASAPKDGTRVDLWAGTFRYTDCRWGKHDMDSRCPWGEEHWNGMPEYRLHGIERRIQPTHWMPLPKPPVTTAPAVDGGGG